MSIALRLAVCAVVIGSLCPGPSAFADDKPATEITALRKALTFYVSFNNGTRPEVGEGLPEIRTAATLNDRGNSQPGLPAGGNVVIANGAGRFGDALRFKQPGTEVVFYEVDRNLAYSETNWNGAISIWLRLDPDRDLAPGYVDPLFVTPRTYDDAALWIDFTDKSPRQFRHGAVADRKVWDPQGRGFGQTPPDELPLATAVNPPFSGESWTHVVISFENFNTGRPDGVSTLYINGEIAGKVGPREQTMTWDIKQATACLGIGYTGLIDELAFFGRSLTAEEVHLLYGHTRPLFEVTRD